VSGRRAGKAARDTRGRHRGVDVGWGTECVPLPAKLTATAFAMLLLGYGVTSTVIGGGSGATRLAVQPAFTQVPDPTGTPAPANPPPLNPPPARSAPTATATPTATSTPSASHTAIRPPSPAAPPARSASRPARAPAPPPVRYVTRFVSDLRFLSAYNGWGPVERDRSNGEWVAGDGRPLTIDGMHFAKGLGVHANSDVAVGLSRRCTRFTAAIGVDDEAGPTWFGHGARVRFAVFADGREVYRSPTLSWAGGPVPVSLSVRGVHRLDLVVGGLGYLYEDHADWAAARVRCRAG
jgi:hypothetical protein